MEDKNNLYIEESNSSDFIEKVIEKSKDSPVLVDFWAPWCNPCKQLTPILEESIRSLKGKVKLIKINIDENQGIAQQLKIQSVPTVLAFFDGKPINGFAGLKNSSEVNSFLKEILEAGEHNAEDLKEINNLISVAEKDLEDKKFEEASNTFISLLASSLPKRELVIALAGLGKCYLGLNKFDELNELIDQLEDDIKEEKEIKSLLKSRDYLKDIKPQDVSSLESALKKEPKNNDIRFELARNLIAKKLFEEAINNLLYIVENKKDWNNGAAKKELLELFSLLGNNNKLTMEGRAKLSNLIFK
ncbi:thioredoxin [Alphaproteobacteria bacterium]|nr:thioredoxin [Alphaproteobacteria bacterium]